MKLSHLFLFSLLSLPLLVQAEEAPNLPDLPDVQNSPTPENARPETTRDLPEMPSSQPATTPRLTPEQIEKSNKENNWLLEGLKEKEVEAEAKRQQEEIGRKTLIDEILERNQNQASGMQTTGPEDSTMNQTPDSTIKPALSTTAWEPLPQIQQPGSSTPEKLVVSPDNTFDAKTGISNVYFDSRTGTFTSKSGALTTPATNQPTMQQPWEQQQAAIPNVQPATQEEKKVLDFEAQLVEQAKAQNKLPENYSSSSLPGNESSPYLLASNSSTDTSNTSNMTSPNFATNQASFQAQPANKAAVAKLQLLEEERQRKLNDDTRPKAMDIHSSFKNPGVEINPRFD